MNLREKLDRLAVAQKIPETDLRDNTSPPCPIGCEHIRTTYPPDYMHGVFPVKTLGGTINDAINLLGPASRSRSLRFEDIAFVDTETTGLSGGTGVCAFLVGIGYTTSEGFVVEQYLMRDFPAETDLLRAVHENLDRFDIIASYNGKAFDMPILQGRLRLNCIPMAIDEKPHLDLLHTARRIWKHRLENCTLKSIESHVLGHVRVGDIDGWLIPQTYFEYLRSSRRELLEPIVHHNRLDILSLACLASIVLKSLDSPKRALLECGPDWYGLGTVFEKNRRLPEAAYCFDRAITSELSCSVRTRCLRSLSLVRKRQGAWEDAVRLWRETVATGNDSNNLFAFEELAKFQEHHSGDLLSARENCRRAMSLIEMREATSATDLTNDYERFAHRLRRIEKKIRNYYA